MTVSFGLDRNLINSQGYIQVYILPLEYSGPCRARLDPRVSFYQARFINTEKNWGGGRQDRWALNSPDLMDITQTPPPSLLNGPV